MEKFIKSIIVFGVLIGIILLLFFFVNRNYIPAPKISTSRTFNEKMRFVKTSNSTDLNIIAIGSSMTLSNLSSQTVTNLFPTKKYLNFSSLGLLIGENYTLLEILISEYKPELVIMCGYPIDFRESTSNLKLINAKETLNYLQSENTFWQYLKYLDLQYYLKKTTFNRFKSPTISEYDYLKFDEYGGIPLIAGGGESKAGRFNKSPYFDIDTNNYAVFEQICKLLAKNNVDFKYIQTPVRKGLMNEELKVYLNNHVAKLDGILNKYDMKLIDTNEKLWADSLFIDYIHLNREGAKTLTKYAIDSF